MIQVSTRAKLYRLACGHVIFRKLVCTQSIRPYRGASVAWTSEVCTVAILMSLIVRYYMHKSWVISSRMLFIPYLIQIYQLKMSICLMGRYPLYSGSTNLHGATWYRRENLKSHQISQLFKNYGGRADTRAVWRSKQSVHSSCFPCWSFSKIRCFPFFFNFSSSVFILAPPSPSHTHDPFCGSRSRSQSIRPWTVAAMMIHGRFRAAPYNISFRSVTLRNFKRKLRKVTTKDVGGLPVCIFKKSGRP
jgi:hypothetical protein